MNQDLLNLVEENIRLNANIKSGIASLKESRNKVLDGLDDLYREQDKQEFLLKEIRDNIKWIMEG